MTVKDLLLFFNTFLKTCNFLCFFSVLFPWVWGRTRLSVSCSVWSSVCRSVCQTFIQLCCYFWLMESLCTPDTTHTHTVAQHWNTQIRPKKSPATHISMTHYKHLSIYLSIYLSVRLYVNSIIRFVLKMFLIWMDSVADAQMLDHIVSAWHLFLHGPINRHQKAFNGK